MIDKKRRAVSLQQLIELLVCPYFRLGDAISVNHITAAVAGDV